MTSENNWKYTASCLVIVAMLPVSGVYAQDVEGEAVADDEELEEIVVTGIRGSLQQAIQKKRNASDIRDVINAEDIGKLPDTNVAEALQRITGVQIGRSLGEGSEVAVRGLSQNRVEVNGQSQPGRGAETTVNFENLPAAMFSSLEVIKTPSADQTEGALGAIIRLNTRKPLDVSRDFTVSASIKDVHSDLANANSPMGNVTITKKWKDLSFGDVGLILSYNYNERVLRQDIFETRGWQLTDGWGVDFDGDGIVGEPLERDENGAVVDRQDALYQPGQLRSNLKLQNRKNTTYKASLQWRPNEKLDLYFDGSWTDSTRADSQFVSQAQVHSPGRQARDYVPEYTVISDEGTVMSGLISRTNGRGNNQFFGSSINPYDANIYTWNAGVDYKVSDVLDVHADFAYGHGEEDSFYSNLNQAIAGSEYPDHFFDFSAGTVLPTVVLYPQGTRDLSDADPIDLTAASTYNFSQIANNKDFKSNTDKAFKLDFDYQTDKGILKSFEFGVRISERSGDSKRDRAKIKNISAGQRPTFVAMDAAVPGLITPMPFDMLGEATGDVVRNWQAINTRMYMDDQDILNNYLADYWQALGEATPNAQLQVDGLNDDNRVDTSDHLNDHRLLAADFTSIDDYYYSDKSLEWRVQEKVKAAYVKANLEGDLGDIHFLGNIGIRYVETKQISDGFSVVDIFNYSTLDTVENTYKNFLPSLNLTFILQDDLFLRFGAGVAMSRPQLQHMAPTERVAFSALTRNSGNPYLKPEKAKSLDASLEWYFTKGGLLSAAVFYKQFIGAIEVQRAADCFVLPSSEPDWTPGDDGCSVGSNFFNVTTWANQEENLNVKGLELGYQQQLDFLPGLLSGFGVQANYTYSDSNESVITVFGDAVGKQDLSKHSYNLVGYYEKGKFSARAAYNWRSSYYDELSFTAAPMISKAYGQLDMSVSYKLGEYFTISAEALNFLNDPQEYYQVIPERFLSYRMNDRRFQVGLSARF